MSGPSQRAAERQAARRSPSARPRSTARTSLSDAAAAVRERPSMTGRAVVLAGVLALLVFTLAVPARELIHQRADINALRAENAAAQGRVDELIVREERLHYVLPGEVGYVVLDPTEAPAPSAKKKNAAVVPWYQTLWTSVETADHAGQPDGPTPIVLPSNAPR